MAGYSNTPLEKKLGLREDMRIHLINAPEQYAHWLGYTSLPELTSQPPFDFVHLFTNQLSELENTLHRLRNELASDGMIWVSWYKKASRLPSEITEDLIRDTCLPMGLVDIKVCSVNEQWSGLKLVIRKELRK